MPIPRKLLTTLALPALTAMLEDAGLVFVDIGGRGDPVRALTAFAALTRYVVCEPEADEAARLERAGPGIWRAVTVIREALASAGDEATLYLTASPGMASLLPPDPAVAARICLQHKFAVVGERRVPTVTLDCAAERYAFSDACFLKLDTQGTELDILRSGAGLVRDAVLGVQTEAHLLPIYRGAGVFADLDTHLRGQGFTLYGMQRTQVRLAGHDAATYSARIPAWMHCLYLRDPGTVRNPDRDLPRLLALALAYEHFDLAAATLRVMGDRGESVAPDIAAYTVGATRHILQTAAQNPEALLAPAARDRGVR